MNPFARQNQLIDPKGRIVAPSITEVTPDQIAPTSKGLTADGALDPKFGKNGHAVIKSRVYGSKIAAWYASWRTGN